MPEEMGKLREKGIQKAVWKGMHCIIINLHDFISLARGIAQQKTSIVYTDMEYKKHCIYSYDNVL